MFLNKYPIFEKGRILKLEMIESLRDFPRNLADIMTQDYSNGILEGCKISSSDNYLVIDRGVVCYNHILYFLKEKVKIPYENTDQLVLLKLKFFGEGRSKDFISYSTQIFLDTMEDVKNDELELCRFKLKEGAVLRAEYVDFNDFDTEYDTICRIEAAYSAKEKSTLYPEILRCFAREALEYKLENPLDAAFCMSCLAEGMRMGREIILLYIKNRYQNMGEKATNQEIYQALKNILREIRNGESGSRNKGFLERRILLD